MNSVNNGALQDEFNYILWQPETEAERRLRKHELVAEDAIDVSDIPPISPLPPDPTTRAQEDLFFIWAVEKLLNFNINLPWTVMFEWCASQVSIY